MDMHTTSQAEAKPADTWDGRLLLAALQKIAMERLSAALDAVLRRADDYLFDSSGQGGEGGELTALRDLRRARAQIAQHFTHNLLAGFQRLQLGAKPVLGTTELSLLSEDALEEQLATEQLVDSLARKHAAALELLDQRLAVVVERTIVASDENPVAPAFLATALHEALHTVELSTALRIALYKFTERELSTALTGLYDRLNANLAEAGVLPRLLPTVRAEAAASASADAASEGEAVRTSVEVPANEQALFGSLIGMLQSWRQRMAPGAQGAEGGAANAPQLRMPEIMSVLSLMQNDPPPALDLALDDQRLSLAEQLRREVLAGARRLGIGDESLNLSNMQEDAVDLVGMLFDVLLDERDFEPNVRRKIGRMLVPYVKVAVKDRRLFLYKGHPARRFLNAVAEACEGNHADGPQERELLERVDTYIDRVVSDFNEDVAIFETLEQELRAFMTQHRQRIEITERRAAEAQSGRERLEVARERAVADVATHRGQRRLPPALSDFMGRYAGHHLVQVILRDGAESERYAASFKSIDALLSAFDHVELGMPVAHMPPLDKPGLAAILSSSGCVGSAADDVIGTLDECLQHVATSDNVELVEPEPAPVQQPAAAPSLRIVGGHDQLDFDPAMAERLRALEVGTWLQLAGESGKLEQAKVSWISPISSRFLFVNRRGIRVLVASAEELAAMARQGRLQLRQADTAFEDAMHQIMGRLQSSVAQSA
jgi:hypothetical protein